MLSVSALNYDKTHILCFICCPNFTPRDLFLLSISNKLIFHVLFFARFIHHIISFYSQILTRSYSIYYSVSHFPRLSVSALYYKQANIRCFILRPNTPHAICLCSQSRTSSYSIYYYFSNFSFIICFCSQL